MLSIFTGFALYVLNAVTFNAIVPALFYYLYQEQ